MKVIKIQTLRGANIWSSYRKKLIQMLLDIEDLEERPTNLIPGFKERLQSAIPSMVEHECSEGKRGGFFQRVERGTWMGHVVEHIALELQTLAGMETGYGRTRSTKKAGVYNVVFSYVVEEAGLYAADAAIRIADSLIQNTSYDIEVDLLALREIGMANSLGPSTKSIVDEAASRNIPWIRLGRNSRIQLGYGINQMRFQATMTCKTSAHAVDTAGDKERTKSALEAASVPVPSGMVCEQASELAEAVEALGFPLVIKPVDANQGKGATINITSMDEVQKAFEIARAYSEGYR